MADKNSGWDAAFKKINDDIKSWGDILAERQKIKASIMVNEIQARRNAFYKAQENEMLNPLQRQELEKNKQSYEYQKWMNEQGMKKFGNQQGNQQPEQVTPGAPPTAIDVLNEPSFVPGKEGFESKPPSQEIANIWKLNKTIKDFESKGNLDDIDKAALEGLKRDRDTLQRKMFPKAKTEEISYTEEFRNDLQDATQRINDGEDYKAITNELMQKYPDKMSFTITDNLTQVAKRAQVDLGQYRNQAVQELRRAKYPVTENNIKAAIKQLRGQ